MAAGDIIKGKDLRITMIDGTIYHATECSLSATRNFDEVATKDTNGNVTTPDTYSWNLSTSALVSNKPNASSQKDVHDVIDEFLAASEIDIQFATSEAGDVLLSGKVYVESIELNAATEGRATYSATFRGNGDLTKSTVTV